MTLQLEPEDITVLYLEADKMVRVVFSKDKHWLIPYKYLKHNRNRLRQLIADIGKGIPNTFDIKYLAIDYEPPVATDFEAVAVTKDSEYLASNSIVRVSYYTAEGYVKSYESITLVVAILRKLLEVIMYKEQPK